MCAVLLLGQAVLLLILAVDRSPRPRDVPVTVVAPAVVAQALASDANRLDDRPFRATADDDPQAATENVRDGVSVAAVLVDLSATTDVVVVSAARDPRLTRAVVRQVRALEKAHGRTVEVSPVRASSVSSGQVLWLALGSSLTGFIVVLVTSVAFGPVARTLRLGVTRLAALAIVFAGLGYAASWTLPGLDTNRIEVALLVALGMMLAALTTLALEALAGLGGLGVSMTLFVVLGTPLLLRIDPRLLPPPWAELSGHTPSGAIVDALSAAVLFDGTGLRAPLLQLLAWLLVALVILLVSRRERGRATSEAGRSVSGFPEPDHDRLVTVRPRVVRWRWRVALFVVPTAVLVMVIASLVPRDALASAVGVVDVATETECVATGRVESVADLNRITLRLRGGPEFEGADVGADVALQDGRRLMVFGDTLRSADFQGQRFVRNSMLLFEPGCIRVVLPADRGALIPDRAGASTTAAVGYWPMSVTRVSRTGYDLVTVTTQRVRTTGPGSFAFQNLGPALAVFVVPAGQTPQLIDVRDVGPDSTDPSRPTWGAALAADDEWVYLYGTSNPGEDLVFGYSVRVARARPDNILEISSWRYWDGSAWVRDPRSAVDLIGAVGGTSQTLSVFEQDGTWYALSKRDDYLGSEVTVWSAPHPWGPFDDGRPVATLPSNAATGQLRYMPLAHPDLLPERGTVVISYSRNRTDVEQILANPFLYRPRFMRVPLRPPD